MPPCSLTQLAWHVGCSPGNGQGRAGNRLWPFIQRFAGAENRRLRERAPSARDQAC